MKGETWFEKVFEKIQKKPGLDQDQLAKEIGIARDQISYCITKLEHQGFIWHGLGKTSPNTRAHKIYTVCPRAKITRKCRCGGVMRFVGFRDASLKLVCEKCGRKLSWPNP